ncbi:YggS family pyridoxal phosphate-dependent enzyme [Thioalkalivibrio sp. XN8]|uniref:YggS family pyridoxal phosphate-dependent enzyme n=1 Tax=Thioalkalivibrio sp. XN8 TaxID=2712863 RepID=UPI0013EBBA31|nr:YggS family pyridoxal phosphate-dependent enzyme [Thioalkalivibrio sp. XN8]NGP52768.1 YggS family pyridoxal phosphate-dependent enzyme [Thioalkalivibrio sp. XN8]
MTDVSERPVAARLGAVRERIAAAARAAGRDPAEIRLVGVSKRQPVAAIRAAIDAGLADLGENFVQEAVAKMDALGPVLGTVPGTVPRTGPKWHFIGALQSNKTAVAAARFDWVQSVDRLKLAERLSRQRPAELPPLNVCLQVHIGAEASKAGVPVAEAAALAHQVAGLPQLRLRGLMAVPPPETDPARQRAWCRQLAELFRALQHDGLALDTLSMGMSDDLEAAIAEGATMVRIGTAVFGPRPAGPI